METLTALVIVGFALAVLAPLVFLIGNRAGEQQGENRSVVLPDAGANEHPSVVNSELEPHMHVVDGVVITHAHPNGNAAHEHSTITVSMKHYAALVKRAERHHQR